MELLFLLEDVFLLYIVFFSTFQNIKKKSRYFKKCLYLHYFSWLYDEFITLNDSKVVKNYPKLLIITYGFELAKIMGMLKVSHVLNSTFKAYRPDFLIPLRSVLIHSIIFLFYWKSFYYKC